MMLGVRTVGVVAGVREVALAIGVALGVGRSRGCA